MKLITDVVMRQRPPLQYGADGPQEREFPCAGHFREVLARDDVQAEGNLCRSSRNKMGKCWTYLVSKFGSRKDA